MKMDQIENNLVLLNSKGFNYIDPHDNGVKISKVNTCMKLPSKKKCCVIGCEESKNLESDLFFKFPEDKDTRQVWTNLTGRSGWTPSDDSHICVIHFSVDSFTCNENNDMVLVNKSIPSLRLPSHVLEIEYIDESEPDSDANSQGEPHNESQMNGDISHDVHKKKVDIEVLKLFSQVQKIQRRAAGLKEKLKHNKRLHLRQKKYLQRLKEIIASKESLLNDKKKKMLNINVPLLEMVKEEREDLIVAMPTKYTDDLKNFTLSVYKYSPQSYIYLRNTLRTMLPSSNVLESWIKAGYQPRNVMSKSNLIKVVSEQTESELSCKISLQ